MTTTTKSQTKKSKLDRLPEDMQKLLCDGISKAMQKLGRLSEDVSEIYHLQFQQHHVDLDATTTT